METRRLRYFVQIAESGSINRAAAAIGIAQPALSQQLAILEAELKARLFVRSRTGVTLTEAGQRLLSRAYVILRQFDMLASDLSEAPTTVSGRLTIGMPPTLAPSLGVGLVSRTLRDHPKLRLHLVEASAMELLDQLQAGIMDMALLPAATATADIATRVLMREELCLAQARDAPDPPPDPAALAQLPWITTQFPNLLRGAISSWFATRECEPRIVAELNSVRVVLGLIAAGQGVTLLPRTAIAEPHHADAIRLVPVDPPVFRTIHVCTRRERAGSAAVAAVDQCLDALAADLND